MKKTLWPLLLLLVSMLTFVSCGSDSDDNDSAATPTTPAPPQNEEDEDTDVNVPVRYSSVEMYSSCGMGYDCQYSLRSDLNRRPVILTANFVNNGPWDEEPVPEDDVGSCAFTRTISEAQADKLEKLADNLRTCKNTEGEDVQDVGEDLLILTGRDGAVTRANKTKLGYPINEIYVCQGSRAYHSYVKSLLKGKVPAECPKDYRWLFMFGEEV